MTSQQIPTKTTQSETKSLPIRREITVLVGSELDSGTELVLRDEFECSHVSRLTPTQTVRSIRDREPRQRGHAPIFDTAHGL